MNFSLVIPTRNRAQALHLTMQHLSMSNYPFDDFEILVVNDGSNDDTDSVLQEWSSKLPLRAFAQAAQGTSKARNLAILEAQGKHILFIDDDVLIPPDFLTRHARLQNTYPDHLIRGPVVNIARPMYPPLPVLLPRAWSHFSQNYLCTSNASIKRELLMQAGLFDPSFVRWEDAELGVRLKHLGVRRIFDSTTFVYHWKPPVSYEQKLQIATLDGQAAAQLYKRYPSLRMWLRSGLHVFNRCKNFLLLHLPLPQSMRQAVVIEQAYLQAGRKELKA